MLRDMIKTLRISNELTLGLIVISTITFFSYAFLFGLPSSQCYTPVYSFTHEVLHIPGAQAVDSAYLLNRPSTQIEDTVGGIPKIIHQSWKEEELPHKFLEWSNSFRLKHPDWKWVLWTDAANADFVESHFPALNESYWALKNSIQRADFARNLYLWEFGGVYVDLDMECLRPLDNLFANPFENISPSFPIPTSSADFAFVGSMEVNSNDWTSPHTIPNAFMASTPHHPLWLFPLSNVLRRLGADADGRLDNTETAWWKTIVDELEHEQTEHMTGPVALFNAVQDYREWKNGKRSESPFFGFLQTHAEKAPRHHDVVVFDPAVIYPFSWATEGKRGQVYKHCRAASGLDFDPIKCQELVKAYERGARMITYWSHTWHTKGEGSDLDVVGT